MSLHHIIKQEESNIRSLLMFNDLSYNNFVILTLGRKIFLT
jgi:hypothetical protein